MPFKLASKLRFPPRLVVSVQGGESGGYKCFTWDEGSRDFLEVELAVG